MVHFMEVVAQLAEKGRPDWVCFHYGENEIARCVPRFLRVFYVHSLDLGIPRVRLSVT